MKRSEYIEKLSKFLVYKDLYLAINMTQATYLAECVLLFNEKIGMLPPDAMPSALSLAEQATKDAIWAKTRFRWESEDESSNYKSK